jgi:hypothetical protein
MLNAVQLRRLARIMSERGGSLDGGTVTTRGA